MTTDIKPLRDKVIGILVDNYGLKTTINGLIINEIDGSSQSIRPRWFKVTHIGPEQKFVKVGDYVLVSHGRWSRGFFIGQETTEKYYHIDENEILITSDELPKGI
jgi:hypothetical protein